MPKRKCIYFISNQCSQEHLVLIAAILVDGDPMKCVFAKNISLIIYIFNQQIKCQSWVFGYLYLPSHYLYCLFAA